MVAHLDDAHVLVTGASSGIGAELARALAPRARVLSLVARRAPRLEALAAELRVAHPSLTVVVAPCDVSDTSDIDRMLAEVEAQAGVIDTLVNNAGLGDIALFERSEWAKLQAMLRVNNEGMLYLTHRLLPGMLARRRGGVLNVSSGFGLVFMPGAAAYVASKHFVSAFTESLRCEVRGTGVVVTQVVPGPVPTEFEQVAGNPLGRPVPAVVQVSAAQCAAAAVAGFANDRAIVTPGAVMKGVLGLGRLSPRWTQRLIYSRVGRLLRELPAAAQSAK